ncbi:zinc finger protein 888-like isoform X1 [Ischnura elegans]|uniref:zinc finger protein 888-like isoform X1 n=1 Tax=Ischnura elegans TaxID=197161 RepID=UPI001ED8B83B|nr:zinc finger protein 888-like isoform X1 [Ischnura elegans]
MGSEHYCLRWNNHQSNLLGVFSQLLQDEALVDVTLACEGHSLRAHKVVLSACSAYFHGLFAAHPDRHPIVILQDAKFSELRTLVDFMYRGEVNVEYGRLSGLLRTAESLKVKGLAETTESNRGDPRCSRPSPTIHASTHEGEDASPSAAASPPMANPLPPDTPPSPPATTSERRSHLGRGEGSPRPATDSSPPGCHSPPRSKRSRGRHGSGGSGGSGTCEVRGGLACHRDVQGADVGDAVTAAEDVATPGVASPPPPSPPSGGPIPGPSGLLLPVQRVPLSLKKEMDWDRASSDDKSGTGESSSEYRHPQETEFASDALLKNGSYASSVGIHAEDSPGYGAHKDVAAISFPAQYAGNSPLVASSLLHHDLMKRIPLTYPLNASHLPSSESMSQYSLVSNSHKVKNISKPLSSKVSSCDMELESNPQPVFHHFLSSMSNFAFNNFSSIPEISMQKLNDKENSDFMLCSDPKEDKVLDKDYDESGTGILKCSVCTCFFRTKAELANHMESHSLIIEEGACEGESHAGKESNEKPFRCDQCGQCYKYGSAFARHREQDHRARPPAEKPFRCDACGMRFRYLKSFKKHRLNHTLDKLRSKSYSSKEDGTHPKEEISPQSNMEMNDVEEGSEKDWKTPLETEINEDVSRIEERETASTAEENQPSWVAPWQERNNGSALLPEKTEDTSQQDGSATSVANQDTPQLWELLLQTSSSTRNANTAQDGEPEEEEDSGTSAAKDSSSRSFLDCPFCRKGFRSRENLRLHVRKHTGERPFECSVCGRAFGGKSDMTRHLRIHTGERPYRCNVCSKRFARADYLSKHLTTHLH